MKFFSAGRFLILAVLLSAFAACALAQNSISGIVFDPFRKPVADIEVELLDGFERLVGSRKTTSSGFYTFQRLNAGIYYIRIRVGGTSFKDATQRVDLGDLNAIGGVDQKQIDLYLEFDERRGDREPAVTGIVYAQEVPQQAIELYEMSRRQINNKKMDEAKDSLRSALDIFPQYFLALESLGDLHLESQEFESAASAYSRAVEINPRCFGCYFNLGIARNKLGQKNSAAESLLKANEIDSGSINSHLLLGIVLRELERYGEAESALIRAKELGRNKQPDVNWQLAELYYFDLKRPKDAIYELRMFLGNLTSEEKKSNPGKIAGIEKLIRKIENEIKTRN